MKDLFFLILGLIIVFGSIFLFFTRPVDDNIQSKIIKLNNTSFAVEVADTPETRRKGLSGREALPEGTGMLFVFDAPSRYGFWMKDMNFAVDIVWIDERSRVIDVEKEVTPETFPQVFYPDQPVKYVLELPTGAVDKYQIATGTVIQL